MTQLKKFQAQTARPLPIIVLADTSGSMSVNGKIEALNKALQNMISAFAKESRIKAELQVAIITFGESVETVLPLTPAHSIEHFSGLKASGRTPMGTAIQLAADLIENKQLIPERAYKPVVILVSDGHPTDDWAGPLEQFKKGLYSSQATCFAMGIGSDADLTLLKEFVNDLEAPVFAGEHASDIHHFFRAVTMSVTTHSRSVNPNQEKPKLEYIEESVEDWEF